MTKLTLVTHYLLLLLTLHGAGLAQTNETNELLTPLEIGQVKTAMSGINLSWADLSYKKDHLETSLAFQKTMAVLNKPMTLPNYGGVLRQRMKSIGSFADLALFNREQSELGKSAITGPTPDLTKLPEPAGWENVPIPVKRAVTKLYQAALAAQPLIQKSFTGEKNTAFAAFALSQFDLRKDPKEVESWRKRDIDTQAIEDLLTREARLQTGDTETVDTLGEAWNAYNPELMQQAFEILSAAVDEARRDLKEVPATGVFECSMETPLGKIFVGGTGKNVYTEEAFLIIDIGGEDTYEAGTAFANGLQQRPVSILIDCGGDDNYQSKKSFSQGVGLFGIGLLIDESGNDTFTARHMSQGAAFFGIGVVWCGPGDRDFKGELFCQSASIFGSGYLIQDTAGKTDYRALASSQAFAGPRGVSLLWDRGGNDRYVASGYGPCGWIPSHEFSLSQGFAMGMRPLLAGGIAILADDFGNDSYSADVYGQGASYWYGLGILLEGAGDDVYSIYQYGQGSGIHVSAGLLADISGNDRYQGTAICQAGAHDYGIGMLIDREGDDHYKGTSTAQAASINNAFTLLVDVGGNDFYAGQDSEFTQASGHDGGKREYGAVAVLTDLGGKDTYSQGQRNNAAWIKDNFGCGLDRELKEVKAPRSVSFSEAGGALPKDEILSVRVEGIAERRKNYVVVEGNVMEQRMRLAMRDPANESEEKEVAKANEELEKNKKETLTYLLSRMDSKNELIRFKAETLIDGWGKESVPILLEALEKNRGKEDIERGVFFFLSRFTDTGAVSQALARIKNPKVKPSAFLYLGHVHAKEAYEPALLALREDREIVKLRAAQALGRIGDRRAIPFLVQRLDDDIWTVRTIAETALVQLVGNDRKELKRVYKQATPRAKFHLHNVLARLCDPNALTFSQKAKLTPDVLISAAVEADLKSKMLDAKKQRVGVKNPKTRTK
ncbi:MAG: HEAT repeat domain-containing protein [Verrucomicrobiota bacterium]|nr:HEAT repeat domain-containing protein [Verrucomicrobiota bacterium]